MDFLASVYGAPFVPRIWLTFAFWLLAAGEDDLNNPRNPLFLCVLWLLAGGDMFAGFNEAPRVAPDEYAATADDAFGSDWSRRYVWYSYFALI